MSSAKIPLPNTFSLSPPVIGTGIAVASPAITSSMVVGISGAPTFTGAISQPSPPTVQMSGWLTRMGASAPLTMRAAMSQVPFPSLIIAQLGPGAVLGGWHLSQGMQNPQYACGMWLYEIEFPSGNIFYVWVQPDGTILESIAANTGPSSTSLATQEDGNKQRGDSIGFVGEGGYWQGEKRSGDIGIAATTDKLIIQTYHRPNGPEEPPIPSGYILVGPSFMKDLMRAYSLYRDEQEAQHDF